MIIEPSYNELLFQYQGLRPFILHMLRGKIVFGIRSIVQVVS